MSENENLSKSIRFAPMVLLNNGELIPIVGLGTWKVSEKRLTIEIGLTKKKLNFKVLIIVHFYF